MIGKVVRIFSFLLFLVIATGALLYFTREGWLKVAAASVIKEFTGFDTTIQSLELRPDKGVLRLRGLTLLNPYEFNERIFADLPEIYLWLDLPTLLRGKGVHLYDLRLKVRELNIEKKAGGVSNISRLGGAKETEAVPPKKKPADFYLDRLVLSLGRVRYHDRSSVIPKKISVDLGIQEETFRGINDPKAITNLVLLKVLKGSPLGPLGLSPTALENRVRGTVNRTFQAGDAVFFGAPSSLSRGAESTEAKMENAVNKIEGSVGKTVQGAKSGVGRLFGRFRPGSARDEESQDESPAPAP